uniref:Uncharacterized protein n=1 Tax=Ralstonia syzygii R24 TaxID=907261 RepID=G3A7Y8_9RALS|nr:hypothetical protein RALSY_40857 [Ralstonia syzygii R24]
MARLGPSVVESYRMVAFFALRRLLVQVRWLPEMVAKINGERPLDLSRPMPEEKNTQLRELASLDCMHNWA